ncbi:unnamed protein product [Brassica rapa subsp. narinosa]
MYEASSRAEQFPEKKPGAKSRERRSSYRCFNFWLLIVGFGLPGSRFVIFLRLKRLEWTLPPVMAGPGRGQPCFAYSTVRVAFGTVRGPSDCSPAVFSSGLCGFDVGSGIISLAVSTANFKVVHGTVSLAKL